MIPRERFAAACASDPRLVDGQMTTVWFAAGGALETSSIVDVKGATRLLRSAVVRAHLLRATSTFLLCRSPLAGRLAA